ncbi:MAG: hypothetical protein SGI92_27885, partial [Bryobacteraceae bacterium]|nr:hypothetical protein [Bryobacteraceae bacterium]
MAWQVSRIRPDQNHGKYVEAEADCLGSDTVTVLVLIECATGCGAAWGDDSSVTSLSAIDVPRAPQSRTTGTRRSA